MTKKLKFVEVQWMDAHSTATWIHMDEELPGPVACVSRGWLIADKPTHIVLAGTLSLTKKGEAYGFGEVISIPKEGFLKKVKRVKL